MSEARLLGSVLYGADDHVADLVLSLLPKITGRWTRFVALGVVRRGELRGGVIFHDYNPVAADIRISAAFTGSAWCLPRTLRTIFDYPVRQLGCRRATMMIAADNDPALTFAERLGFRLEGRMRQGADRDTDRLIYGVLIPEELNFWRVENG